MIVIANTGRQCQMVLSQIVYIYKQEIFYDFSLSQVAKGNFTPRLSQNRT
jgi:hypothetical protein